MDSKSVSLIITGGLYTVYSALFGERRKRGVEVENKRKLL